MPSGSFVELVIDRSRYGLQFWVCLVCQSAQVANNRIGRLFEPGRKPRLRHRTAKRPAVSASFSACGPPEKEKSHVKDKR
jgi:hypothetical protein